MLLLRFCHSHLTTTTSSSVLRSFSSVQKYVFPSSTSTSTTDAQPPSYQTIKITPDSNNRIISISLNRPEKGNAFNVQMWEDYTSVFTSYVQGLPTARVCILSGEGKHFSTGMDLSVFSEMNAVVAAESCEGRRREGVSNFIQFLQDAISAPEVCKVPVIAAISGHCIGGAIDLISACDLRYCTEDATFCIKETDLGMVADIGTLQRLPKLISEQRTRELTYTSRVFNGKEAAAMGLVLECFPTKEALTAHVSQVAAAIASKSPLTVRGIKKTVLFARDHSVNDSLNQVKLWNSAYLFSTDLTESMRAARAKETPSFK